MKKELKQKLLDEYKSIFINVYEAGGGYGFRYFHGLRTMKYCEKIMKLNYFKNKNINKDATLIAALFADVGKIEAVNSQGELVYGSEADLNHDKIGVDIAKRHLVKFIKDEKLIDFISQIISEQHGTQTTLESKIVKDADRLDNYGYIQIWRHITYALYDKRNIDRLSEFWFGEGANIKAKNYLKKFNFLVTKQIAVKRYKKLNQLILEIDQESEAKDIK